MVGKFVRDVGRDGKVKGVFALISDITKHKVAERELQNALAEIKKLKDRLERENIYLREEYGLRPSDETVLGESAAIQEVLRKVQLVADTDSTVLLLGETGTGKELVAEAIHNSGPRKDRALVKVNCAALPASLVESELFGREKGAYTGALTREAGRFEVADGSTIFLDEVAELPLELQGKLLRVLQEGQFERLGSTRSITVDVRVIAATNRDLDEAVQKGTFRKDLYYRLNVFPISSPPLRERREDIPLLVWAFVQEFSAKMGKTIETISRRTMEALVNYVWPGNIRELRNIIERAMITSKGSTLHVEMPTVPVGHVLERMTLQEVERSHIIHVLEATGWRIRGDGGAAQILGLKPTTLDSRIQKLGIKRSVRPSEPS
jgi:transcriptional regulator with GAF, ATPase, and Fis domain